MSSRRAHRNSTALGALQPEIGKEVAGLNRRILQALEVEPLVRIEIEDDSVGLVDILQRDAPVVDLQHADLHQAEQPRRVAVREGAFKGSRKTRLKRSHHTVKT